MPVFTSLFRRKPKNQSQQCKLLLGIVVNRKEKLKNLHQLSERLTNLKEAFEQCKADLEVDKVLLARLKAVASERLESESSSGFLRDKKELNSQNIRHYQIELRQAIIIPFHLASSRLLERQLNQFRETWKEQRNRREQILNAYIKVWPEKAFADARLLASLQERIQIKRNNKIIDIRNIEQKLDKVTRSEAPEILAEKHNVQAIKERIQEHKEEYSIVSKQLKFERKIEFQSDAIEEKLALVRAKGVAVSRTQISIQNHHVTLDDYCKAEMPITRHGLSSKVAAAEHRLNLIKRKAMRFRQVLELRASEVVFSREGQHIKLLNSILAEVAKRALKVRQNKAQLTVPNGAQLGDDSESLLYKIKGDEKASAKLNEEKVRNLRLIEKLRGFQNKFVTLMEQSADIEDDLTTFKGELNALMTESKSKTELIYTLNSKEHVCKNLTGLMLSRQKDASQKINQLEQQSPHREVRNAVDYTLRIYRANVKEGYTADQLSKDIYLSKRSWVASEQTLKLVSFIFILFEGMLSAYGNFQYSEALQWLDLIVNYDSSSGPIGYANILIQGSFLFYILIKLSERVVQCSVEHRYYSQVLMDKSNAPSRWRIFSSQLRYPVTLLSLYVSMQFIFIKLIGG